MKQHNQLSLKSIEIWIWKKSVLTLLWTYRYVKKVVIQNFESFRRPKVDLVEDNIRLVLGQYKSSCVNVGILHSIYTLNHLSQIFIRNLQLEYDGDDNGINIEIDDLSMNIKLVVGSSFLTTRFDEKSFLSTMLGFNPHRNMRTIMNTLAKEL